MPIGFVLRTGCRPPKGTATGFSAPNPPAQIIDSIPLAAGDFGVFAQTPDMVYLNGTYDRHVVAFSLLYCDFHRILRCHMPKSPVARYEGTCGVLLPDLGPSGGNNFTILNLLNIARQM